MNEMNHEEAVKLVYDETLGRSFDRATKRKRENSSQRLNTSPESRRSGGSSTRSSLISSRLERLATPRRSSSWKKPIHSKYSHGKGAQSNREALRSRNKRRKDEESSARLLLDSSEAERRSSCNIWKDELSPELNNFLSTALSLDHEDLETCQDYDSGKGDIFLQAEHDTPEETCVADILSTPIISSVINHPYHSSCPPPCVVKHAVLTLQREVIRLTDDLAVKNRYISELEAKAQVAENDDSHDGKMSPHNKSETCSIESSIEVQQLEKDLIAEVQRLSQITSPELEPWPTSASVARVNEFQRHAYCGTGHSIVSPFYNRQDSFGDFVVRLSGELDSKIDEIKDLDSQRKADDRRLDLESSPEAPTSPR